MNEKSFYQQVIQMVNYLGTEIPIDVAVLGRSVADARYIYAHNVLKAIAQTDMPGGWLHLDGISAAFPPDLSDNLFIEFNSEIVDIPEMRHGSIGIHLTTWEQACDTLMFQKNKMVWPERFTRWPLKYVFVIYRELNFDVYLAVAGAAVALNTKGEVRDLLEFPTVNEPIYIPEEMKRNSENAAGILAYLIFSCFGMINQGEAFLQQVDENCWVV